MVVVAPVDALLVFCGWFWLKRDGVEDAVVVPPSIPEPPDVVDAFFAPKIPVLGALFSAPGVACAALF